MFFKNIRKIISSWVGQDLVESDLLSCVDEATLNGDSEIFFRKIDTNKKLLYKSIKNNYLDETFSKLLTLKIINLIVLKYHYYHKHTTLTSRPFHLMVDPSNSCQLHCPGCIHTHNEIWRQDKDWPNKLLDFEKFEKFLRMFGPFAFAGTFYNYGEPLINKRIHEYIALAKKYLIYTEISSNLSLPSIDAEALVKSGLDNMFLSVDGATQKTYETFRRGGNLQYVLKNLKELVGARNKLGIKKPYLIWRYLTFEHNLHEVEEAFRLAREIGVDAFDVTYPFDVSNDDPAIKCAHSPREGRCAFNPQTEDSVEELFSKDFELSNGHEINQFFNESFAERAGELGVLNQHNYKKKKTCGYLYKSITMDGAGRIIPCCGAPSKNVRHLSYGDIRDSLNASDLVNLQDMSLSRLSFTDPQKFDKIMGGRDSKSVPYCRACGNMLEPPFDLEFLAKRLPVLDRKKVLSVELIRCLTEWLQSN